MHSVQTHSHTRTCDNIILPEAVVLCTAAVHNVETPFGAFKFLSNRFVTPLSL